MPLEHVRILRAVLLLVILTLIRDLLQNEK